MLSPTRVSPSTVSTIARPGKTPVHQMPAVASDEGLVQVVTPLRGGGRFDAEAQEAQPARVRMASEAFSVKISGSVRVAFLKICRHMMRAVEAPTTLADSTKGSAFSRMVSARMTRKYCGMKTTVMEMAAARMPPQQAGLAVADGDGHHDRQQQRGNA